jgi:hypothetical protein
MSKLLGLGLAAFCLLIGAIPLGASDTPDEEVILIRTPETKIVVVAVAPRVINEGLVDTTKARQSSSGLPIVGIGEQVYLAASTGGLTVTNFTWTLTKATGSSATLIDATGVGKTFTADVAGEYLVTLKMTHAGGDTTVTQSITASSYVGTSRCAQCHAGTHTTWLETNHAEALKKKISGLQTGHFGSSCIKCHSVGANTSNITGTTPANGGFWDIAVKEGWAFPSSLTQGTWVPVASGGTPSEDAFVNGAWALDLTGSVYEQMPAALKDVSNIGCEACHGPGNAHASGGFSGASGQKKIGLSLENGVCARCHDDGHYHVRPHEWDDSGHGQVWTRNTASCSPCHLGSGRIAGIDQDVDFLAGETAAAGTFALGVTQTCATCHNPHSKKNEHQVRWSGTVEMEAMVAGMGEDPVRHTSIDLGLGAACAQCHHLRPGANALNTSIHHSHQTEMVLGIGGYHFEGKTYPSGGHKFMPNACVNCHMADPPAGADVALGSHSWKMHDEETNTYNTAACESCHGPMADFNVNGARTETAELLAVLKDVLPPSASGGFATYTGSRGASRELTPAEARAGWNAAFVSEDGSGGVHNYPYARRLLVDALDEMRGTAPLATAGDFDGNGQVGFSDVFMFTAQFGKTSSSPDWEAKYDLSGNGTIGFTDWLMLIDIFGQATASAKPAAFVDSGVNTNARFALYGSDLRSIDQQHIAVRLTAAGLTDMRGYAVGLNYDTDDLEFVRAIRASNGLIPSGNTLLNVMTGEPGRLTVSDAIVGDETVHGGGDLVDVIFRMKRPAGTSSVEIDFTELADANYGINRPSFAEAIGGGESFEYALGQNFPNPFNPETSIRYSVAEPGAVRIAVYNALGQQIRTLVSNHKVAGDYTVDWDARDQSGVEVASGVYIYRMEINGFESAHRMVLVR